jgi:translocation and assembly module TamA
MLPYCRRRIVSRVAILAAMLCCPPAVAQVQDDGVALDPDSPLDALPDIGIDWPDLAAPDPVPDTPPEAVAAPTTEASTQTVDGAIERSYRYVIEGLDGLAEADRGRLRDQFEALSTLEAGEDDEANVAQIDRRAREDEVTLRSLMRAYGHYDSGVVARVESPPGEAKVLVTLRVFPGPLYSFSEVSVPGLAGDEPGIARLRDAFTVKAGDPIIAANVKAAEEGLKTALGRNGFAFGTVGESEVTVDHDTHFGVLTLDVSPGRQQRFGRIVPVGQRPLFSQRHLDVIARFEAGSLYDSARIEDFRRALIATSLVSSVTLTPQPGAEPDTVDIAVALERAPTRTIAGELGYGTGEGYRAEVSWQHRNLLPPEGAVTFRGVLGTQEQLVGAQLRRGNFRRRDQVLTGQAVASATQRDAYDARTLTLAAGIERQQNIIWQKKWIWSAGVELIASDERDTILSTGESRRRTFFIGALPASLGYDGSDDLLDPTRGFRLTARISPEASFQGSAFGYVKAQIDGSAYVPVGGRTVIAGRARLGSLAGASRDRIAPSRRFYSGGGGSVRGYGFQNIGPEDLNGDPIGGRALAEFALEARVRFGAFGVVPFVDAGNIYSGALPKLTGLRVGTGIGVRYHTNFGPIRVDVGTPLNRRPGEPRVAVYVSLGQAF